MTHRTQRPSARADVIPIGRAAAHGAENPPTLAFGGATWLPDNAC